MATTPLFSLRYPSSSDPVDVANDFYKLATDTDTKLGTLLPKAGGTLTGDLTVSKASPSLLLDATSGSPSVNISGVAGTFRGLQFKTAGLRRWTMYANADTESGSNAGSDFAMYRANDAGSETRVLYISRATGKTTFDAVGATAGLELGSSGPRIMSGTGSPEGVVTAPVGSTWTDTAATTGAIQWIKATGTGNTGWVVQYGDTGTRNLNAVTWSNSWASYGGSGQQVRRSGNVVNLRLELSKAAATDDVAYTLPTGFRPAISVVQTVWATGSSDDYCAGYIMSSGVVAITRATMTSNIFYGYIQYLTADAWPSSLPGTAI